MGIADPELLGIPAAKHSTNITAAEQQINFLEAIFITVLHWKSVSRLAQISSLLWRLFFAPK